jgi:hypothetical protein
MIIKDIKFTGFKHKDSISGLDLTRIETNSILSERGENKNFLFKSLLGIVFGFSYEEKEYYRDRNSLVFTGLVDLKFENYTLHIERDFETNIIALLSESDKDQKAIYQGKDDYNKPAEERPYLDIIKSFFSINDKDLLLKACEEKLAHEKATFGELLDTLYLFLRPIFKRAAIDKLISSSAQIIDNPNGSNNQPQISVNLQKAIGRLSLLKIAKKIFQSKYSLKSDIEKFEDFLQTSLNGHSSRAQETLKQRFPLIYQMDAEQVKNDIAYMQKLQSEHKNVSQELQKLDNQKRDIETLIGQKLMVYSNLPDSFIDDFHIYQNLTIDIAQLNNEKDRKNILLNTYKSDLQNLKNKNMIFQSLAITAIFVAGALFFPDKMFWVTGFALALLLISTTMFFQFKKSKSNLIELCRYDLSELSTRLKGIEKNVTELRKGSYLLDDLEYIDTHIERFKKYKHFQTQLKKIDREKDDLQSQLNNDKFKIILPRLEQQYRDLINLNPPEGLDEYLEEFKSLQNAANASTSSSANRQKNNQSLDKIIKDYRHLLIKLDNTKTTIEEYLGFNELENDIDSQISYLERAISHLKQKIHLEKTS